MALIISARDMDKKEAAWAIAHQKMNENGAPASQPDKASRDAGAPFLQERKRYGKK